MRFVEDTTNLANELVGSDRFVDVIDRAELEHSIVLAGSRVHDLEYRVEASLIGRNVQIGRGPALPKAYRFVVGDNSEIAIL